MKRTNEEVPTKGSSGEDDGDGFRSKLGRHKRSRKKMRRMKGRK